MDNIQYGKVNESEKIGCFANKTLWKINKSRIVQGFEMDVIVSEESMAIHGAKGGFMNKLKLMANLPTT